jgi:hypothetical protein
MPVLRDRVHRQRALNHGHPLLRGLRHWWTLFPGMLQAGTWYDCAGTNHGVLTRPTMLGLVGDAPPRPGAFGEFTTDGTTTTYARFANPAWLSGATRFTLAAWVRRTGAPNQLAEQLGIRDGGGTGRLQFRMGGAGNVFLFVSAVDTDSGQFVSNDLLWHHYCWIYDGAQASNATRLLCSMDGVLQTLSFTGTIPAVAPMTSTAWYVGYDAVAATGALASRDDIALWDRALTSAEATAWYLQSLRQYPDVFHRRLPPALVHRAFPQPIRPTPVAARWQVLAPQILPDQPIRPTPLAARWQVRTPTIPFDQAIRPQPLAARWQVNPPTIRRMGIVPTILDQDFVAADWLVEAPELGLRLSYDYNPDGTWEHRIAAIGDIEWSVPPGGGIITALTATVDVLETGEGMSILELWQVAATAVTVVVTLTLLLQDGTRIPDGLSRPGPDHQCHHSADADGPFAPSQPTPAEKPDHNRPLLPRCRQRGREGAPAPLWAGERHHRGAHALDQRRLQSLPRGPASHADHARAGVLQ